MPLDKPKVTSIKATSFYIGVLHLVFRLGNLHNQLEKDSFNVGFYVGTILSHN